MMGRTKRPHRNQTTAAEEAGNRMKPGNLEGLLPSHRRQHCWESPGQHGLARPRRTDHRDDEFVRPGENWDLRCLGYLSGG